MKKEDEQYFNNYFDLFLTDGWKQLVTELNDTLATHKIEEIKDEQHLYFIKGERAILNNLVNFENGIRNAYDITVEADNAEAV